MTHDTLLSIQTAQPQQSIWLRVGLEAFRENVARLAAMNKIPASEVVYDRQPSEASLAADEQYILPFETERQLADDFALLASLEAEPKAVSAASIQEQSSGKAATLLVAANESLSPIAKSMFDDIVAILRQSAARSV